MSGVISFYIGHRRLKMAGPIASLNINYGSRRSYMRLTDSIVTYYNTICKGIEMKNDEIVRILA